MYIAAGYTALCRMGLSTWEVPSKFVWTLHMLSPFRGVTQFVYCWSPWADKTFHTFEEKGLLYPTRERALIEYIIFMEKYFDEGVLIEGLQTYMDTCRGTLDKLLAEAELFKIKPELVEYWWKEAVESPRT